MKIIAVYKNVEWNQEYNNIPYFPDKTIDKTQWLLKNYCNGKTDFSDVSERGDFFNITSTTDATFTLSLKEVNQIKGYESFTIFDLLRVNYFVSDQKQYFFVKLDGVEVVNGDTITYQLSLDSWMTNIESVFLSDKSQDFYVKRGHYDRLKPIAGDPDAYTFDYSFDNPNWDPINNKEVPKQIFGADVLTCLPKDTSKWTGNNINLTGHNEINSVLNEIFWMTIFVPIGTSDSSAPADEVEYKHGTKITLKNGEVITLPYQLITVPLKENCGVRAKGRTTYQDLNADAMFDQFAQTSSKIIGATVTRGLFPGFDFLDNNSKVSIDIIDKTFNVEMDQKYVEVWTVSGSNQSGAIRINNLSGNVYNPGYFGNEYSILDTTNPNYHYLNQWFDSLEWARKAKLPTGVRTDLFYSPRFTTLSVLRDRTLDLETYLYNEHILKISLNGSQEKLLLNLQLMNGKSPSYFKTTTFDNGVVNERKDIETGNYRYRKWVDDNLVESKTNVFPTASSSYQDYMLQNQAQRGSEIAGTAITTGSAIIGSIISILTGGVGVGVGIAVAAGVNAATSGGRIVSKRLDAQRQPNQSSSTTNNVINELMTNIGSGYDYITLERAVGTELNYYYEEVYRKGVLWEFSSKPRLDSRYYFNYWQIEDSESVVDVSNLSSADISVMKAIFENGVRLWHIRDADQKHNPNQYQLENLEMSVVED